MVKSEHGHEFVRGDGVHDGRKMPARVDSENSSMSNWSLKEVSFGDDEPDFDRATFEPRSFNLGEGLQHARGGLVMVAYALRGGAQNYAVLFAGLALQGVRLGQSKHV